MNIKYRLFSNCSPLQADRDAVAMIRSKMTRLPSGSMADYHQTMKDPGLRRFKTKLEIRKPCWTGLPKNLIKPKTLPSGMRYTNREVFRLTDKIIDNFNFRVVDFFTLFQ